MKHVWSVTLCNNWQNIIACVFVLIGISAPLSGEAIIGGEGTIEYSLLVSETDFVSSVQNFTPKYSSRFIGFGDVFEFNAHAQFELVPNVGKQYDADQPAWEAIFASPGISIDELWLRVYLTDFLTLTAGRFYYLPGVAEFFSNTNYFSQSDLESVFAGGTVATPLSSDMTQLSIFLGSFYLQATASPFWRPPIVPDAESPWFPTNSIPASVVVFLPLEREIFLDEVFLEDAVPPDDNLEQWSFSVEVGGSIGPVDLSLLYYDGWDNSSLLNARIRSFADIISSDEFDIVFSPYSRKVRAIGANLQTYIGAARLWADASYSFNKRFIANELTGTVGNTVTKEAEYLELTYGTSYEFPFLGAMLMVEGKNSWITTDDSGVSSPFLQSLIVGTALIRVFEYALTPSVSGLVSQNDWSAAILARISYAPTDEFSCYISAPFFLGEDGSELGQYKDNHLVTTGVTWRY